MQKIKALLIDDEQHARDYLRELLADHPEVEIVGEAASLQPARTLIARGGYDCMFLDVKLGPDTGFDLVADVPPDKSIIFVTGYDQHANRAFEVNAVDYLMKPVRAARLSESLQRVQERKRSRPARASLPPFAPRPGLKAADTVLLEINSHARLTRVAEIVLIVAQGNYSSVHLADGSETFVRRSLKSWIESLPPEDFVRIHRAAVVNLSHLTGYRHESPRQLSLTLAGLASPVGVSRESAASLKQRLRTRFPGK